MRVLILGGDGYLGWPTAMALAAKGNDVFVIDNYLKRSIAAQTDSEALIPKPVLNKRAELFEAVSGHTITVRIGDLTDYQVMERLFQEFKPEAVVHYAEQPSAPYSMMGGRQGRLTLINNLHVTYNLIQAVMDHAPRCHIVKLGTMGEYGTPNIDIEEGWLEINHKDRRETFLYPRQASSLYHTTKIMDTDLLWFYVRTKGLRVTDLMQGPVYGLATAETEADERLAPSFHYDDIFGTVVNRFLIQAVVDQPLTVFGQGGQTRGYLNLQDTIQCIELALANPVDPGNLRILNQFTETFTVNQLADRVAAAGKEVGLSVTIDHIPNPRQEAEEHYYNPKHSGLLELGLKPHFMTTEVLVEMLEKIKPHAKRIDGSKLRPRVSWAKPADKK